MRKYYITLLFVLNFLGLRAQDIIVNRDASEIKCKVTEIGETSIKYKKWEMLDGPLYNAPKADVFMIIYANGTREKFNAAEKPVDNSQNQNVNNYTPTSNQVTKAPTSAQLVQQNTVIKNNRIEEKSDLQKYNTVARFALGSGGLDFEAEWAFGKKGHWGFGLNLGLNYDATSSWYAMYFLYKYPIDIYNNNFKKGSGLFLWANSGLIMTNVETSEYDPYYGHYVDDSYTDFNFLYEIGADLSFPHSKLGVTVYTTTFSSIWGGIFWKL
jgi:hypothetical protein